MERVYLLLRDNEQTGPFTIGELLQQQLRSTDMIWIEGKSTAWTYLSELELDVHVSENEADTPPVNAKDEIEQKAEELRQKVLASSSRAFDPRRPVDVETYGAALPAEDDEIEFVDHRQRRKARRNLVVTESLLTCVVVGLFFTGIYKGQSFLGTRKRVPEAAAVKLNTGDNHAAHKSTVLSPGIAVAPPDTNQQNRDSSSMIASFTAKPVVEKKTHPDSSAVKLLSSEDSLPAQPVAKQEKAEPIDSPLTAYKKQEQAAKKEPPPALAQARSEQETANDGSKDEKKGFLRGLFKKKKKHEGE